MLSNCHAGVTHSSFNHHVEVAGLPAAQANALLD
jgi:hypothetical protein